MRLPRVTLPDGKVVQIGPSWPGKLSGFTLLFEAFALPMCLGRDAPDERVPRGSTACSWRPSARRADTGASAPSVP